MSKHLSKKDIWTIPVVLGALSAVGLTTALISDSTGDVFAWFGLAVPVLVVLWFCRPLSARR